MPFPKKTALERLLVTERHRRRTDESSGAGFATPAFSERPAEATLEPLAVTNARGQLVSTTVSRARGVARYGFFECPTEAEGALVSRFHADLWRLSEASGWENRCTSLTEASARMPFEPRSIVVPYAWVEKVAGVPRDEADRLMGLNGFVSKGEQQVLVADLPEGHALVAASPALLGIYTRIDDRLGILMAQVDRTLFLVRGCP